VISVTVHWEVGDSLGSRQESPPLPLQLCEAVRGAAGSAQSSCLDPARSSGSKGQGNLFPRPSGTALEGPFWVTLDKWIHSVESLDPPPLCGLRPYSFVHPWLLHVFRAASSCGVFGESSTG
jgi:hypothetical protein